MTAHHYSMLHKSAVNKAYVEAFRKAYGIRPAFHSVAGYDAMHLLHQALEDQRQRRWRHPHGSDERYELGKPPRTNRYRPGDAAIQNEYIRRVEKVNGELYNVEFATIEAVKDPFHGGKK